MCNAFNARLVGKLIQVSYGPTWSGAEMPKVFRIDVYDALSGDPIELRDLAEHARCSPEDMVAWLRQRVYEDAARNA